VKRVTFEYATFIFWYTSDPIFNRNGIAVGVEYLDDAISCPAGTTDISTVRASKLVVVCGGAFGSPTILERSGIGSRTILEKKGVPVVVDLPGVGENYQGNAIFAARILTLIFFNIDHYGIFHGYHASDDTATMKDLWSGNVDAYQGR